MIRDLTPAEWAVDVLIAAGYALIFVVVPLVQGDSDGAVLLTAALIAAALGVRRRVPALALVVAWSAAVLQMVAPHDPDLLDAGIPPIVYACAAYGTASVRWAAFTSSFVGGGVAGVFAARSTFVDLVSGDTWVASDALRRFTTVAGLTAVTLLLAWTLGVLVRTAQRSRRNRQEADAAGRQVAAEQERTRIARDMHDVVAHSLAVVIAQSDGARMVRRTDPDAVEEALETIGATARAALSDVRVLLQQLRYEGTTGVQPGLADLDALLDQFRASGLAVELRRDPGADEVGTAAQLAAFRIVQESLTNALRHGDTARSAAVVLSKTGHGLSVQVDSAIDPARPPRPAPGGHGLIGMRERASAVQGDLQAAQDGDRFRVRAFLPATATAALQVIG